MPNAHCVLRGWIPAILVFPDQSFINGFAAAHEDIQRNPGRGRQAMEPWTVSEAKAHLSKTLAHRDAIVFAVLATAFGLVIIFGGKAVWPPAALLGSTMLLSWRAGRAAGLITSVVAAVLLRLIRSDSTNIWTVLSFLFLCAAMSWLFGSYRDQWNQMQTERDEMRIMLDRAPVGIALFDVGRRVLRCNPTFREIYGWNDEDIVGHTPPLPDSQRESWDELVEHLQAGKSFVNIETVRARKDGSRFYARISGSPVFNRAGGLVGLVGFIARTEDGGYSDQLELRNLESLVQSSSDFMCVAHLDRKTFFLNDAGKEMIGLPYETDISETPLEEFFVEEDRGRIEELLRVQPLQRIGFTTHTVRLKHSQTEEPLAVSCGFYLITDPLTHEPSSFACVAKSLGSDAEWNPEPARGEEAFRSLFRNAPVAIALVNTIGEPFESNMLFQQMLGYGADELRRMRFSQLVHPEDLPAGRKLFLSLIEGKIDRYQVDKRLLIRNGDVLLAKMTVALMRDRAGNPSYSISMVERVSQPPVPSSTVRS